MRDILFRGKRLDNGEWVCGYYVELKYDGGKLGKCGFIYPCTETDYISVAVDPKTIGQYTGLTDKNGKKIFENDIVEYDETKGTFYQIIWIQSGWGSREIDTNLCELFPPIHTDNPTYFDNAKIVGNVHDNPELLEVG